MTTVGDPLCDLGYLSQIWMGPDDPQDLQAFSMSPTIHPNTPRREEMVERYGKRSGLDLSRIHYYEAFNSFRFAVILAQIYYRYWKGQTSDERFAIFVHALPPLARAGLARLKLDAR